MIEIRDIPGPFWCDNEPFDPDKESAPREGLFRVRFSGTEATHVFMAAETSYQCWLNGEWLAYGPARAPHGVQTVDRHELPPRLLRAANELAVQVFWEGIFINDHTLGQPGLRVAVRAGACDLQTEVLATGKSGRRCSHYYSHQRGWIEEIDARRRPAGWPAGPFHDAEWGPAVLRTGDPVPRLELRDIKPFIAPLCLAQAVSFAGSCDPSRRTPHRQFGYSKGRPRFAGTADSPARVLQEERLLPAAAQDENLGALTAGGGSGAAVLGADERGLDRSLQLDFGQEVSGLVELVIDAPAGTVLDLGWSEILHQDAHVSRWFESAGQPQGSVPPREPMDSRCGLRWICRGGGESFTSLFFVSARHLRLAVRRPAGNREPVRLRRLAVRGVQYPLPREGEFRSPDDTLNRIFAAAVETVRHSTFDVYMDCPGRERAGWLNDSYWTAAAFTELTGDWAYDRRFLRQFAQAPFLEHRGTVPPMYPSDCERWPGVTGGHPPISGHSLFWLMQVARHVRLTGDREFGRALLPAVEKVIAHFATFRAPDGLFEGWPHDRYYDWSDARRGPIATADCFLYAAALRACGVAFDREAWRSQAEVTAAATVAAGWDAGRELFADTIVRDAGGGPRPGEGYAEAANYIALWTGWVPDDRARRLWRQLGNLHPLTLDRPLMQYEGNLVRVNAVGLIYRLDWLGRTGRLDTLRRDLTEAYGAMLARGQTTLSESLGYHFSMCHGYNGYVARLLLRYVAGIELPDDADGMVTVRPRPELLPWCQGRVAWRGGHVQAWWSVEPDGLRLMASAPAGCRAQAIAPDGTATPFTGALNICW
jgi:alpha-L-rhamnosidase